MSAAAGGRWIAVTRTGIGSPGDIYGGLLGENTLGLWVEGPLTKHANDISADDRFLLYDEHQPGHQDLWVVVIAETGEAGKPIPFLTTPANESWGRFSPDNRWIAYTSNDSGRPEVFLRRFMPDEEPMFSTQRWQVSTQGGAAPRWSADGGELYYTSPERDVIISVSVGNSSDSEPELGTPDRLFRVPGMSSSFRPYDVSPDGRFLVETVVESEDVGLTDITVVTNWIRALER